MNRVVQQEIEIVELFRAWHVIIVTLLLSLLLLLVSLSLSLPLSILLLRQQ